MSDSHTHGAGQPSTVAEAQVLLDFAPYHRFLGLRIRRFGDGEAEIVMPFREETVGDPSVPYIHGGVIASLLDTVGDFAVASRVGHGVPTIDMRVDYLRAASRVELVASARLIRCGRTLAIADAEVRGPEGELFAVGRILYSSRRAEPRPSGN